MASLFNWFNRSLCKCHFTSNRKGCLLFSSCPQHPASDVSLPTYQPEDSGLVPLGFLMRGSLWRWGLIFNTHPKQRVSSFHISFHCGGPWSGLKDGLSFLGCSFPLSAYFQAPFRPWWDLDALVWQPVSHGDTGCRLSSFNTWTCPSFPSPLIAAPLYLTSL